MNALKKACFLDRDGVLSAAEAGEVTRLAFGNEDDGANSGVSSFMSGAIDKLQPMN